MPSTGSAADGVDRRGQSLLADALPRAVERDRDALAALDRMREQVAAEWRALVAEGDRLAARSLNEGVLPQPTSGRSEPLAGNLGVQGLVARAGRQGRFDDVFGPGFQLIVADGDPLAELSGGSLS